MWKLPAAAAVGAATVLILQWLGSKRTLRRGKGYTSIDAAQDPEVVGGVVTDAYEGTPLASVRHNYCVAMSSPLSEILEEVMQKTQDLQMPQMLSSPLTVHFLQSLIRASSARRVLEIGTYTGFTALGMAEVLPPSEGLVLCLDDFSDEAAAEALCREAMAAAGSGARIELRKQKALEGLKQLAAERAVAGMAWEGEVSEMFIFYHIFKISFQWTSTAQEF